MAVDFFIALKQRKKNFAFAHVMFMCGNNNEQTNKKISFTDK